MPKISVELAGSRNATAFLDMLAYAEGTSTSKHTKDDGYDVIVAGLDSPNCFASYADHPMVLVTVNNKGLKSSAAGRYQQMRKDWLHYKSLLNLPDFGRISQDRLALQHIRECRALPDIHAGRIELAIIKCRNIWASLPGAGYGQREHRMPDLLKKYVEFGGRFS